VNQQRVTAASDFFNKIDPKLLFVAKNGTPQIDVKRT
jgi:hypothetical protein